MIDGELKGIIRGKSKGKANAKRFPLNMIVFHSLPSATVREDAQLFLSSIILTGRGSRDTLESDTDVSWLGPLYK